MTISEKILDWIHRVGFPVLILYLTWRSKGFETMVFIAIVILLIRLSEKIDIQVHINGELLQPNKREAAE